MKKILFLLGLCYSFTGNAQETIYPAKENKGIIYLKAGTIHLGNGEILNNAIIKINGSKIEQVGAGVTVNAQNGSVIDLGNSHVYPGLILPSSTLGLKEIGSGVRGSNDSREIGEMNPSVRAISAYNADSKIINTLRSNGVLLAQVAPEGDLLTGLSSVVQLDAWNYEDAAYKTDMGMYLVMPNMLASPGGGRRSAAAAQPPGGDRVKEALDKVESVKQYFRDAKAWYKNPTNEETSLKFEAAKGLFNKTAKLFVAANQVKQMLVAIDFVKEFGFEVVIVGGSDSWQIANLLKANNISVILGTTHSLPTLEDDDVDQPYKTPAMLAQAGVLFALNDEDDSNRGRNLAFIAGTAAAYGLPKEQALQAITLNAAKILGIADKTGSLEAGKDANIVVSSGDLLDFKTSVVTHAFIQGRAVELSDKHKQLFDRYKHKYGIQ